MSIWTAPIADLQSCCRRIEKVLDLGCGTGLELDEIFSLFPEIEVTGVDLCREMLDKLAQKHPDKNLKIVCSDYFRFDLQKGHWDAVISFESLHHFLPGDKLVLYRKIRESLKDNGIFLLGIISPAATRKKRCFGKHGGKKEPVFPFPRDASFISIFL